MASAGKGSKGSKRAAAAPKDAAGLKKKFVPTVTFDDVEVLEMLNKGTAKLYHDWDALRSHDKNGTQTKYSNIGIVVVDENGVEGEPHKLHVRTSYGHTLKMAIPGEGFQKVETPSYIVVEGLGRGAQPAGADTKIYDSQIREKINAFLAAELAPDGAGAGFVEPGKLLNTWLRHARKEKDEKGRTINTPYENGPYLVMTTGRFTRYYNGLEQFTDPQTGTSSLAPLKMRGNQPVTSPTLHNFLQDSGTLVTSVWQPGFNISGYGLSPHAELVEVIVFPGTGKKTTPPTTERLLGTRVQADMAALQKLAAANRAAAAATAADDPADDEFDGDDAAAQENEEEAADDADETEEEEEKTPPKSKSAAKTQSSKMRAVQAQLESEPGTEDDDDPPPAAPPVTATALLKPAKATKPPAKNVKAK